MYHRSMNYSRDSGTMLIPTRFVWPYGGRIVFISGSFTGWSHWPMTPVEGCPTVFQTICSLPPGYHQYKFVVDGEWRHDEHQPSISSNIGTVNTILLNREADYVPAMLSPQMPLSGHVSNMDVDNDPFHRMVQVQLSDGSLPESFPTVSNADIELSRRRIDLFLSTHQAYEMLPESGKVVVLDVELPVKQAFHILYEQGIPTAPLWNSSKGKFVGILSAVDFIIIMREQLSSKGSNLTEEELDSHTISAWKEAKSYMSSQVTGRGGAISRQLGQVGPDDSLKEVALKILQGSVSTVPIIYSPSRDGSNPQLLHVASLSGILKCICRFFKHSPNVLPVLKSPISTIPLGTWVPKAGEPNQKQVAMLRPSASLSTALNLLIQAQVSSIPIVDDHNTLVDVFSRSDITTLAKDKVYANVNLDEMSIHQALQIRDDPAFDSSSQRCFMCLRTDPLHKVLDRISQPGVRRLVVVEAGSKRVEGIISLGDVFRFLISS